MKIVVINGTEIKGCTHQMKQMLLQTLGQENDITEYSLPHDCPVFCTGCKGCFLADMSVCPHAKYTVPIWEQLSQAELIVITSPTYVFHVTGQLKALLDHYGSKWMVHSPDGKMFSKQAVVLTNAIGMGTKKVIRDIQDSLDFWGVAKTYHIQQTLHETDWSKISSHRKEKIQAQCDHVARKLSRHKTVKPRLKIRVLFHASKLAQKMIDKQQKKSGGTETQDHRYWQAHHWLDGEKPY